MRSMKQIIFSLLAVIFVSSQVIAADDFSSSSQPQCETGNESASVGSSKIEQPKVNPDDLLNKK